MFHRSELISLCYFVLNLSNEKKQVWNIYMYLLTFLIMSWQLTGTGSVAASGQVSKLLEIGVLIATKHFVGLFQTSY
jgi:hypothetical protein